MIKKISLFLILGLLLPIAGHAEIPKALTGFGLGAKVLTHIGHSKVNRGYYQNNNLKAKDASDLSGFGTYGGTFITYNHIFSSYVYLGVEISAHWGKMKGEMKSKALSKYPHALALDQRASYGGALKIGGVIWNVLPYLKVGGVDSKWHAKSTFGFNAPPTTKHVSQHLKGLVYGIGIEIPVHDRLSLGGEMIQTHYKKLKFDHHMPGNLAIKYNLKPRHNTFALTAKIKI